MLGNFSTVISEVLAYAFNGVSEKGGLFGWRWYALYLYSHIYTK
jgi:hypothetical protein